MAFSAAAALSSGKGKSYSNQRLIVTAKPRQIGVSQRSLTRRCRLGRATELVFITAMGAMITIGGQAAAQSTTYTNGENRAGTLNTTGNIALTVNAGEATQSGVISGSGNLNKQGTGTLTLSEANTYTGTTTIDAGTLRITNVDALGANAGGTIVADGATLELGEGDFLFGFMEPITLHGAGVADGGALRSVGVEPIVISGAITLGSAARITSDNRGEEFGDLRLVGFSDPGEPEHAGVLGIAQHGMGNLPNADDPLLQALDDRHGRDHGAVTDHEVDLVTIGVIADPAVISQERVAEQFGEPTSSSQSRSNKVCNVSRSPKHSGRKG